MRIIAEFSMLTGGGKVNGEFLFAVDAEELVTSALIISSDGTASSVDTLAGQIKILADMAGIDSNNLVRGQIIAPLHARRNYRPEKRYGRVRDKVLTEAGFSRFAPNLVIEIQLREFFIKRQIAVKTDRQVFNMIDD